MFENEKIKQDFLSQIDIKQRNEEIKKRDINFKKKYLSEIIKEENPRFERNNLILAPVGAGKTHAIENMLIPKDYTGKILYLVSNTALKDSLCPSDNNQRRKDLAEKGESICFHTTNNKSSFGNRPYSVHVMTYHEFGERIKRPSQNFTDEFNLIFCDEIHSLPEYLSYGNSFELGIALYWLFQKHDDKTIYYFTATKENLTDLDERIPGYLEEVKIFDYLNHPEIKRYVALSTYYINHISQLRQHLKARLDSFNYYGLKALAFTRLISEQEKIAEIAETEGYSPLILWSINNERKMSKEQLDAREYILNTGLIPDGYNFLIINGAMQEGWNLYDDKIELGILDTVNITEQIQSLGRIRRDIDLVIKKTKEKIDNVNIEIREPYMNTPLTPEDKQALCDELSVINDRGQYMKWPSIKKIAIEAGYNIEDKIQRINGKRTRVSIIRLR